MLGLVTLGRRHGVADDRLVAGTGFTVGDLSDRRRTPTRDAEFALVRNLLGATDPALPLALEAGLDFHLGAVASWGDAMRTSESLAQAVEVAMAYAATVDTLVRVTGSVEGEHFRLRFAADDLPADLRLFLVMRLMVTVAMTGRELLGYELRPAAVTAAFPPPPYADALDEFSGVGVEWGVAESSVAIPAGVLSRRLRGADEAAHAAAVHDWRRMLERYQATVAADTVEQVRAYLERHLTDVVGLVEVAQALNSSERSLRRHLAARGTSFRALAVEVRLSTAMALLEAGVPVAQVAARVGYRDRSAFNHAFRRWSGVPPRRWQRERDAG